MGAFDISGSESSYSWTLFSLSLLCVPPSLPHLHIPLSCFFAVHLLPNLLVAAGPQCAGSLREATCSATWSVGSEGTSYSREVPHT